MIKIFSCMLFIILFTACETIDKKIDETMKEETKMLSKFLGKKSFTIKTELGEPDLINFNIPYKTYIYYKKNLLIKCTREFFINPKTDLIEKFNSKNCIK
jgi:hypothetical protein|tara:strand:+ start:192 stop:491 length:300 start_codon:yes stop_codon:yes gene_type:complete